MQRNAKQQKRFVQINQATHTELQRFTSLLVATSTLHTSTFDSRLRHNPKNLPTTPLFESIMHKRLFRAIFISGMFGHRVVIFLKFLINFVSAKPTAEFDFLRLKDLSQRILQIVGYLNRLRKITRKARICNKRFGVSFLICSKVNTSTTWKIIILWLYGTQ